jgi:hypothetical protein
MNAKEFSDQILKQARLAGYSIQTNRDGFEQIDFGNKKLHSQHLLKIHPLLISGQSVSAAINAVAPGRSCSHRPMKQLIAQLQPPGFQSA